MAGKVAQIQEIITPDTLAKQLASLYNKWWIQRQDKEEELRELRNYIFATDTTKTTNSKLPWKNKTTIPKLTQIRDNLHANYMAALFPNDDFFRWEGFSADAMVQKKRKIIQHYMKNKVRESAFKSTISDCLYDWIDTGNAFGEVVWVNDRHIDPVTEEEIVNYVGPKLIRTSFFDIVFNPLAPSFKESPKFTRYIKSIGELKKDAEDKEYQYNKEVVNKIIDQRKALNSFRLEDVNKAEGFQIDGFGSMSEYYSSGMAEILEFEGDIYDVVNDTYYEKRIITIVDRTQILRNIPNPSWLGKDTKVHVGWRDRPDNLYSMGPLDNLVGLQYRIDHLENLKADALDLAILPPIKKKGDVEPFEWGPGVQIDLPEDGDVEPMVPPQQAFMVNNEIGALLSLMEEMAGAPKEAMGFRTPGEKTAFEVDQLQTASQRIFRSKADKFEVEFVEPVLNMMFEMATRKMDTEDVVRIMDDDLGVVEFMSITKADITAKGKLRPIGSRYFAARGQLMQNLVGIMNSPVGQMIAPHMSSKSLAKLVEEQLGFEQYQFIKDNIAIMEQKETQSLINQASSDLEAEASVPVEEEMLQNTAKSA